MTTSSRVRISVERALSVPLSTQIRDQVVAAVSTGDLKEGERTSTSAPARGFPGPQSQYCGAGVPDSREGRLRNNACRGRGQ